MKYTAYLLAHAKLDPNNRFQPVIDRVQISSNSGPNMAGAVGKEMYFTVLECEGETYDKARDKIFATLENHPMFQWCKPLLM